MRWRWSVRSVLFAAGTSVLWWLYIDHRLFSNTTELQVAKEPDEEVELDQDKSQALMVYATSATVFTVRLPLPIHTNIHDTVYSKIEAYHHSFSQALHCFYHTYFLILFQSSSCSSYVRSILFHPVLSCSIHFYPILSCSIQLYPVLSTFTILSCCIHPFLSCFILFYPFRSGSILFYPVPRWARVGRFYFFITSQNNSFECLHLS